MSAILSNRGHSRRLSPSLPILLLATAGYLRADVTITSGTITTTGGAAPSGNVQLQGNNLSLTGSTVGGALALLSVGANSQTVTFSPEVSASTSAPGLTLVYNGTTYSSYVFLSISFTGPLATTSNIYAGSGAPAGTYQGTVSSVPFAMTGTITVHAGSIIGPAIVTIPISGPGLYSALGYGNFLAGGPGGVPQGNATFQFAAHPLAIGLDTTTQGAWNGKYGLDGYLIANGASKNPSYATVGVTGASNYTWAGLTTDPRALQNGAGVINGIASSYNGNFNININFTDGNTHRVAIYLLDWDTTSRAQTITIYDAVTNAVLDTENFTGFHNGQYFSWNLRGNVRIAVVATGGGSGVVSGIFFGPGGSPAVPPVNNGAFATYAGLDTTTHGTWTGQYGANGYFIANGVGRPAPYATASVTGASNFTWANQTSDIRALQSSAGSAIRIASAYTQYPGTSFNINVNVTDGNVHRVALYMLDWDSSSRSQTITLYDASTNVLLDTQTFSGFHDGQWAIWNIRGNVLMKVTPAGSTNPAVSGIFFN